MERVYTLEADGQPILCFQAASFKEAQSLLKEQWLLSDLRTVKFRDTPVWDGKARLKVRNALPEEAERFTREAKPGEEDLPIVYLV